jgi:hypothetical protein
MENFAFQTKKMQEYVDKFTFCSLLFPCKHIGNREVGGT